MKILVFGLPGSGKTTFCNRLSKKMGIPIFHVDRHFFEKGWKDRPHEDFIKDVKRELEKESWIIDGNAMRTLEMRYKEATIVIYCCPSRLRCLFRVFYRWIVTLGQEKPDGPEGAVNSVTWKLLCYIWHFPSRYGPFIHSLREQYPQVQFFSARSDWETEDILNKMN